jgi:hypothetical protein
VDLLRGETLIAPVVELLEQRRELRMFEARELRGAKRALHRAGVDGVEMYAAQLRAEVISVFLSARGERDIGDAGVPSGRTPLGLAVASEIELEAQAGLPIISGRPDRNERLALSITAPARTR